MKNELYENLITIDIDEPAEFYEKILNLNDVQKKLITENAFAFYKTKCSFENFKITYLSTIEGFLNEISCRNKL